MNPYEALRSRHQKEVNDFPMFFAFNNKQFEEGMRKFGLDPSEKDKIYKLSHSGGFYLRTDSDRLKEMFNRHERELQEAIEADKKGNGFIFDMFYFELANHEYGYTRDIEPTLEALGLTMEDIEKSPALTKGLKKACAKFKD